MRAIKFRGKRVDNGEWVYGYYVVDAHGNSRIYFKPFDDATSNTYYFVDQKTVGQLWIPSLGVELYGGDICTATCSMLPDFGKSASERKERIIIIGEHNSGHVVSIWYKGDRNAYYSMDYTSIKVIGNIHDNPELLK